MSFVTFFTHTIALGPKTVKIAKNTICDTCGQSLRIYEFCDIFAHTVVISPKMVRSPKNSTCDTCVQISKSYEFS